MKIRPKIKSPLDISCFTAYVFLAIATLWLFLLSVGYRGVFLIIISLAGLAESIFSLIIFKKRFNYRSHYLERGLCCFIFFIVVMTIFSFVAWH